MPNPIKIQRKRFFVDPKVQGALIARVVLYWVICLTAIALLLLYWNIITGPPSTFYVHFNNMWFVYGLPAIASFVILPFVIIDVIRMSNRFVGPLLRLRRSMRALARGEYVESIEFRGNDFWHDLADDFNAVRARIRRLSAESKPKIEEDAEPLGIGQ
jgi:methyl-accepting chemotaxis protein